MVNRYFQSRVAVTGLELSLKKDKIFKMNIRLAWALSTASKIAQKSTKKSLLNVNFAVNAIVRQAISANNVTKTSDWTNDQLLMPLPSRGSRQLFIPSDFAL